MGKDTKQKGNKEETTKENNDNLQESNVAEEQELEQEEEVVDKKKEDLEKRVKELESQVVRVLADYQNLAKRALEERKEWIVHANRDLLLRLLPGLDMLMLASKHINDQGLTLSIQQFLKLLEDEGVRRIETVGKTFDPHTMECVETVEGESDKVITEIRPGYIMGEKVLRSAQVKVGKVASS